MALPNDQLRAMRLAARLTQTQVAEYLGVKRGTYKNWEYGFAAVPAYAESKLRELLVPPAAGRQVLSPPSVPVTYAPIAMHYAGYLPAGNWAEPLNTEVMEEVEAELWKSNRFCARIAGDSCHPALQREDFCVWEASPNPPFGKLVVAQRKDDHAATVKVLEWDPATNGPVLRAVNPLHDHEPSNSWSAIAFLVAVRWTDIDGGRVSFYRPEGIKPSQLLRYRS